jgi:hypothetical protein
MIVIREGQEPVEVKTGDDPFQTAILVAFALWGIVSLATLHSVSTTTTRTLPTWGVYLFFTGLTVGSVTTLVGVLYQVWLKEFIGFYIERAGLVALTGLCLAYSVWALAASGARAIAFALILTSIGTASLVRIHRIRNDLRQVRSGGAP